MDRKLASIDQVLHALADSSRRKIIEELKRGPRTVSELASPLGVTLAAVIQHIQILEKSRLLHSAKVGRTRICTLHRHGFEILENWVGQQTVCATKSQNILVQFQHETQGDKGWTY